ncbi:helix-turn-helix domain-containing protein [Actinoplanes sp. NPDC048796]|uniref:TetR/AcrR family transcriptional regulator n=1 Tax=Actinoplanes sp. NPDC048796 TaxID=3155640 RepID=UPI0033CEBA3D
MPGPRRSPKPQERQRDAERTRQKILDAAAKEFAAHGYAGARVRAIAERAGVNQQLLSYYFDGKEGLFRAMNEQWAQRQAVISEPGTPLPEQLRRYAMENLHNPDGIRMLAWAGLQYDGDGDGDGSGDGSGDADGSSGDADGSGSSRSGRSGRSGSGSSVGVDPGREQRTAMLARGVEQIAARTADDPDVDPACLLVMLMAAAMAPTTIPQVIAGLCQTDPKNPEFIQHYAEQMALVARKMEL